jgi:predicted Rossmann fold flavoprotein
MFPTTDDSQTIIDCLMNEAARCGVDIKTNTEVKRIEKENGKFQVYTSNSGMLTADFICIATGGYPKASMFQWLQTVGHSIAEPVPSLFTFNLPKHPITELMGVVANPVRVKIEGTKLVEEGPVLVTHWGLSGPGILRLSAWGARELEQKEYRFRVHLNWMPQFNEQELKAELQSIRASHPGKKVANHNFTGLPARLFQFLLDQSGLGADQRFADLPGKVENTLVRNLVDYVVEVQGKTTYKEEFVTAGGIQLSEVDANTMMSRKMPHLFFAGEVMDVDGITGGFNFQHAWSSGWIAAKNIAALAV